MRETEAPAICESGRQTATPSRYGKARLSSTLLRALVRVGDSRR